MDMKRILRNVSKLPEQIVEDTPKLKRGMIWCTKCGKELKVDSAQCLRTGWPECCDETMTLESPEERKRISTRKFVKMLDGTV